mgnify:FL=1
MTELFEAVRNAIAERDRLRELIEDYKSGAENAARAISHIREVNTELCEALDNLQACSTTVLSHHGQVMKNSVRRDLTRAITDARVSIAKAKEI